MLEVPTRIVSRSVPTIVIYDEMVLQVRNLQLFDTTFLSSISTTSYCVLNFMVQTWRSITREEGKILIKFC